MFQKALVCNSRWYLLSVSVIGLLGTSVPEPAQFWDRSNGGFVKYHGCSRGREQGSYFYHLQTLSLLINDNRPLLHSLLPSELLVEEAWLLIWVSKRGKQSKGGSLSRKPFQLRTLYTEEGTFAGLTGTKDVEGSVDRWGCALGYVCDDN